MSNINSTIHGLDIITETEAGFHPVVDFGQWRTAVTCYGKRQSLDAIKSLSRHLETDEVFILVKGSCTLFIGGQEDVISEISVVPMELGCIYNVKKGTWHARALTEDSLIVIVENRDTGDWNSESQPLTEEQVQIIQMTGK